MKTKLMLVSILTAVCIFVFTAAAWADGKKNRRDKNPKQKYYTFSKRPNPGHHQIHWKEARRYQDKKHRYYKRFRHNHRSKYHRLGTHDRNFRHKPYYRNHDKHYPNPKPRHYIHRPVKKHRPNRHYRPIYGHKNGKVSILTSTSDHGWSIKISSKGLR